jgi:pimeloyl-ACP methyl ester carboxylesterase
MVHAPFRVSGSTPALGQWVEQFLRGGAPARNRDASRYATLRMPSLVLWGEDDTVTPLAGGQALARLLPDAEFVTLPRTGHIPAIESPELFREALLRFLNDHPASRADLR